MASELLLPDAELSGPWVAADGDVVGWATAITAYAGERNVSSSMVAYRLYRRGFIDAELWRNLSRRFRDRWRMAQDQRRERLRDQPGGPGYYSGMQYRLGSRLVTVTGRLAASGALTTTKAGRVLGVRPEHVQALAARL